MKHDMGSGTIISLPSRDVMRAPSPPSYAQAHGIMFPVAMGDLVGQFNPNTLLK